MFTSDNTDSDVLMMLRVAVGCGNCVLKIYTSKTAGLPAYELCGENRSYSGMTILSQTNSMRLKYDYDSVLFLSQSLASFTPARSRA